MSNSKQSFGRRETSQPTAPAPIVTTRKPTAPKCYLQRRLEPARYTQFKRVKLIFNNGYGLYNGLLRDISENGAKIETVDAIHIPDTFTMTTADGRINQVCHKVWRNGHFIGVKFTP